MELLHALGINETVLPQLLIFLYAYIILYFLVFKPYLAAYNVRKEATVGSQENAQQIALETKDLHFKYEQKAKEINHQIKSIYDNARREAGKLQEEIIQKARAEADLLMKQNRTELTKAVGQTRDELKKTIPDLSQAISNRLLGKEVH
jgi:F-type H+-transporting ATPase subunit b